MAHPAEPPRPRAPHSLRAFIRTLFEPLALSPATLAVITDDAAMRLFAKAFTSPSADPRFDQNYERLEFVGDTLVNDAVASYAYRQHRWTEEWMTLLKHSIIKTGGLGVIAHKLGFLPHIRMSVAERAEINRDKTKRLKLLEDVFEAFAGAAREAFVLKQNELVDERCPDFALPRAGAMLGTALVEELVFAYLNNPALIHVGTTWRELKDPKTRVKEYYTKLGWPPINQVLTVRPLGPTRFVATLRMWPHGPRALPVDIAREGETKREAESKVALVGMDTLLNTPGFPPEAAHPPQRDSKKKGKLL